MPPPAKGLPLLVCLVALGVNAWGLVAQKHLAALPPDSDPTLFDYPLRVNGIEAASPSELQFLVQGWPPGSRLHLDHPAGESELTLVAAIPFRHWLLTAIEGLFFWLVATFFFAPRSRDPAGRDFFACTLLYGLAVTIGGIYFTGPAVFPRAIPALLQMFCLAFLPAFFLRLALVFPRRSAWLSRAPGITALVFGMATLVFLWQAFVYLAYFQDPGPATWRLVQPSLWCGDLLMVLEVAAGCALLFHSGVTAEIELHGQQARWLLTGFVVGVTPYVFLRTLPSLWGASSVLPPEFDRLFELAIPAAFVFAVLRHRLLDIDVIIQRGTTAAFLAAVFMALYLILALSAGRLLAAGSPERAMLVDIGVALLAVVLFNRTRPLIGRWVDRTFFKVRYDNVRSLRFFRRQLSSVTDEADLARLLVDFTGSTLAPHRVAAILPGLPGALISHGPAEPALGLPDRADTWIPEASRLPEFFADRSGRRPRLLASPRSTTLPDRERSDFPAALLDTGYCIAVPILMNGRAGGALLLGEKSSGRRYMELDLKLLGRTAALAGRTLERLHLIQSAAREAYERQRLDELNRMKSDFLGRVAHDLRTPLASIRWSADNLADGVAGPMSDTQIEYARAMRASAGQLGRLIDNLLELSRLEAGGDRTPIGPVDLPAVIEDSLTALKPLAGSRGVEIRFRVSGSPPAVKGNAGRFQEVLNNLLDNALAFSPSGTSIDITLSPEGPGWWTLIVRDHGPGFGGTDPGQLFERFSQGQPGPYGRSAGFGLGLFVVRSYLEQFGGTVTAADHPDGGAQFTCRVREWEPSLKGVA